MNTHTTNTALFLVVFALIAGTPVVLLIAGLRRSRRGSAPDGGSAATAGRPTRILVTALVGVAALGGVGLWVARSLPATRANGAMPGMDMGSGTMDGADAGIGLPAFVADQAMVDSLAGEQAVEQVARLHASSFPILDATIATYGDGVTIWAATAEDPAGATAMARDMARRIAAGGSPFDTPHRLRDVPGVWETSGMGQLHYFFARGEEVWWLSSDASIAARALADVLDEAGP